VALVDLHAVPDEPESPAEVKLAAAVDVSIAALAPPEADAAVVALARKMATVIDDMDDERLSLMIGQTAPQLLKVLQELELRAAKRRAGQRPARPNRVANIRAAHAQSPAKKKRAG
jgi:hypothetical protein